MCKRLKKNVTTFKFISAVTITSPLVCSLLSNSLLGQREMFCVGA